MNQFKKFKNCIIWYFRSSSSVQAKFWVINALIITEEDVFSILICFECHQIALIQNSKISMTQHFLEYFRKFIWNALADYFRKFNFENFIAHHIAPAGGIFERITNTIDIKLQISLLNFFPKSVRMCKVDIKTNVIYEWFQFCFDKHIGLISNVFFVP